MIDVWFFFMIHITSKRVEIQKDIPQKKTSKIRTAWKSQGFFLSWGVPFPIREKKNSTDVYTKFPWPSLANEKVKPFPKRHPGVAQLSLVTSGNTWRMPFTQLVFVWCNVLRYTIPENRWGAMDGLIWKWFGLEEVARKFQASETAFE